MELSNPFSRVYFDRTDKVKKRLPIPNDVIREIQNECYKIDDDMRWLLALISDTGMRLSEAAGLSLSDLMLDHEIPHVIVQTHLGRTLKTRRVSVKYRLWELLCGLPSALKIKLENIPLLFQDIIDQS